MNDTVTNIWNIHGLIKGDIEPDRYILFGSHRLKYKFIENSFFYFCVQFRDAWTMGAIDPISGHSVTLEIMRGLSELVKSGWKPRRSILMCSWDAEGI